MAFFQTHPEYMYFTGVEITLTIDGEDGKQQSFVVSKIDDAYTHQELKEQGYLLSLSIKEGTLGTGQQLVVPDVGGGIASGVVRLVDKDNAIFLSLIASKTKKGKQLLNRLDITLKTYTGPKSYKNCRINKWTCDFNGGVPTISLEWQSIGGDNAPAFAESDSPAFNPNLAKQYFIDEGITENFGNFITKIKEVYNNNFSFKYTTEKIIRADSLKDISPNGVLQYFDNNVLTTGKIIIPQEYLTKTSQDKETYRFKLNTINESLSFLTAAMKEVCSIAKIEGTDLHINWKLIDGNVIFIYTYKDMGSIALPEEGDVTQILANSVFIYNSSFPQGSLYTTPQGSKLAFTIDSISTSFDFSQVLVANVDPQSNASCPNGNMFITSRGALMLPPNVPAQVQKTIKEIESLNLTQNFTVKITVYNFAHFYVLGQTLIDLVVFDHMGNIHPITGKMRVVGYQYDIGSGGVIKADVTLAPPFSVTDSSFENTTPEGSKVDESSQEDSSLKISVATDASGGRVNFNTALPNVGTGKAELDRNAYGVSGADVDGLPQFLGIKVKALPEYNYAVERTKYFKEKPKWVFVHYTAGFKKSKSVASFFLGGDASTHFACDSNNVYRVVKEDQPAIHTQNSTQYPYKVNGEKDPKIKPILTEEKIYECTQNPDPVYKDRKALNFKSNKYWRYDTPSHNHTIWKEIESSIKAGNDIKDQWGNSYKNCIKNGIACGNANANSFGVDLCDYRLKTDKAHYDDSVGKRDWYIEPGTIENGAKTVAYLCYKYDIPISRVMRHCDSTGKPCPRPYVSLPQDGNFDNELHWKILRRKSDNELITPDTYAEEGVLDYSYSYDPRIHLIETEDSEPDITKRTSFLGKVAGYIEVLKQQGYPKYSGNLK